MVQDLLKPQFDWRNLFEPYPYSKIYHRFLQITLSCSKKDELGDWVGWVKSRFPGLLVKVKLKKYYIYTFLTFCLYVCSWILLLQLELQSFCDPNPSEYFDESIQDPNVVFYWGLAVDDLDLDLVQKEFQKNLGNGFKGITGKMTLSLIQTVWIIYLTLTIIMLGFWVNDGLVLKGRYIYRYMYRYR